MPLLADTVNAYDLFAKLDFVSYDNYPGYASTHAQSAESGQSLPLDMIASTMSLLHDGSRSILHKPFLIMEEQSGKAGQPEFSPQPDKGQLRLWSYQAVAHGAMGINYFRWDTANFGAEEYWHGLLIFGGNGGGVQSVRRRTEDFLVRSAGCKAVPRSLARSAGRIRCFGDRAGRWLDRRGAGRGAGGGISRCLAGEFDIAHGDGCGRLAREHQFRAGPVARPFRGEGVHHLDNDA